MRATPCPPFTPPRLWSWRAGLFLAAVAVLQQLAVAAGAWLPGWQPWPYLLLAGPLLWWGSRLLRRLPAGPADPCGAPQVPSGALLAGPLVLTAGAWAVLQDHESLIGHEESVCGNRARSWSGAGTPAAGWGPYRPPVLPLLGSLALRVHEDVGALRVVGLLLALATVTVTYLVVAHWTSARQSALVVLLLLGGLGFLRRLPQYLTDIGATGLLVVVVWILVRVQEKPGSRALWALPPVVLAAFYLRYGVVGNLLAIALGALIAYGPRAWAAQGRRSHSSVRSSCSAPCRTSSRPYGSPAPPWDCSPGPPSRRSGRSSATVCCTTSASSRTGWPVTSAGSSSSSDWSHWSRQCAGPGAATPPTATGGPCSWAPRPS
ncbi:hypothetical protein ACFV0R_21915 [Streptomyces sp. NPDC059578]|uniref:hypothetical protein n=1 Tax=Streptomyces sp. NPDC059578 TaxID=3346874 RepID=UPI00368662AD